MRGQRKEIKAILPAKAGLRTKPEPLYTRPQRDPSLGLSASPLAKTGGCEDENRSLYHASCEQSMAIQSVLFPYSSWFQEGLHGGPFDG